MPLYGLAESGAHWFETYHKHHLNKLDMVQSTFDPCLLIEKTGRGLVGLQTDDSLILADDTFAAREQEQLTFLSKPRQQLTSTDPIWFNGAVLNLDVDGSIAIRQPKQVTRIELLRGPDEYINQRARGAYLATVSQPERAFAYSFIA